MTRNLSSFQNDYFTRTRSKIKALFWFGFFQPMIASIYCSSSLRVFLLRLFGSSIGQGIKIKRGVRVHFPWNLEIGNDCWVGEEVWFINHEKVTIGSNVCISQRSIICSGGHDYRSASLKYAHRPIEIKDGAWVCLDAKVLPGVTIGECSVISAGEVVRKSVPNYSMLVDGQIRAIEPPK